MTCEECGRRADERASGWRAFVLPDEGTLRVLTYCRECAECEFGARDWRREARDADDAA